MIKTEIGVDADVASLYLSRAAMKCACTVLEHHIFAGYVEANMQNLTLFMINLSDWPDWVNKLEYRSLLSG